MHVTFAHRMFRLRQSQNPPTPARSPPDPLFFLHKKTREHTMTFKISPSCNWLHIVRLHLPSTFSPIHTRKTCHGYTRTPCPPPCPPQSPGSGNPRIRRLQPVLPRTPSSFYITKPEKHTITFKISPSCDLPRTGNPRTTKLKILVQ